VNINQNKGEYPMNLEMDSNSDGLQLYIKEIEEIKKLCEFLQNNNVPLDLPDLGTISSFTAMCERGEYGEAYDYLLGYLRKRVSQLGIC
jgi:hypothetical protein